MSDETPFGAASIALWLVIRCRTSVVPFGVAAAVHRGSVRVLRRSPGGSPRRALIVGRLATASVWVSAGRPGHPHAKRCSLPRPVVDLRVHAIVGWTVAA